MNPLTGLFLGAGASYEAGMPLASELTDQLKRWLTAEKLRDLNSNWRSKGAGYGDAFVDEIAAVLDNSKMHYEAIIGHIETQFRRHHSLRTEYEKFHPWLIGIVYHLLYYQQTKNIPYFNTFLPRYDGIRTFVESNSPLWVFSLNHDIMIELIAARLQIPIYTGFKPSAMVLPRRNSSGRKTGHIQVEVLTCHNLETGTMNFPNPPQPGIYLFKLHGALDEFTFNDGLDLLKLVPSEPGPNSVIEVLRAANEELLFPLPGSIEERARIINEIIYADDNGEMQFLRRSILTGAFKFDPSSSQVLPKSVLNHFRTNINFLTKLICIGYSFGDFHINSIIRQWLEVLPERQLQIVSPGADVPSFLLHLVPQIVVTNAAATDFLDQHAGIVRSRPELFQKRLAAYQRSLGDDRFNQLKDSFVKTESTKETQNLLAKITQLPRVNGRPDLGQLKNDDFILGVERNEEDIYEQMVSYFDSNVKE